MQDPNKFLMGGGGAPSAKFSVIGTEIGGTICEDPTVSQQTDYETGKPLTWDDGNPRMQVVVTVQTNLRDPNITDDDGRRRFYIKGQLKTATADAIRRANASGLEKGGYYSVKYTGDGEAKGRLNPPKQHYVTYVPPAQVELAGTPATPAQTATPAPAAPAAVTPEQVANAANNPQIAALLAQLQNQQQ